MSFHEAESIEIDGGKVWLPSSVGSDHVVINTGDAVWLWCATTGTYIRISIKDGVPVTDGNIKSPPPEDSKVSKKWNADFK